ncbi:TPA: hypothetical protein QDZ10_001577 [Stenotrophomonas maltophilia]|uniref:hypothetical protein n=1 Tax=Stenotrophomonas sp. PS02300 TaxID=2991426 RepID=UPI00249B144B|nr:hypothetical protein [Stenotrophomonas sp. PS02300]HDS0923105.1 hypothetical protein [Stenotrophomonas maltophilia]
MSQQTLAQLASRFGYYQTMESMRKEMSKRLASSAQIAQLPEATQACMVDVMIDAVADWNLEPLRTALKVDGEAEAAVWLAFFNTPAGAQYSKDWSAVMMAAASGVAPGDLPVPTTAPSAEVDAFVARPAWSAFIRELDAHDSTLSAERASAVREQLLSRCDVAPKN